MLKKTSFELANDLQDSRDRDFIEGMNRVQGKESNMYVIDTYTLTDSGLNKHLLECGGCGKRFSHITSVYEIKCPSCGRERNIPQLVSVYRGTMAPLRGSE